MVRVVLQFLFYVLSIYTVLSVFCLSDEKGTYNYVIHRFRKKGATIFFAITLPNPNRSSKFFHHHT